MVGMTQLGLEKAGIRTHPSLLRTRPLSRGMAGQKPLLAEAMTPDCGTAVAKPPSTEVPGGWLPCGSGRAPTPITEILLKPQLHRLDLDHGAEVVDPLFKANGYSRICMYSGIIYTSLVLPLIVP